MTIQRFAWAGPLRRWWLILAWLFGSVANALSQDPCHDFWPAPVRTNGIIAQIDLDDDSSADLEFQVETDGVSGTVYSLVFREATRTLAGNSGSAGFTEKELVGGSIVRLYTSPGAPRGILVHGVRYGDDCPPDGCYGYSDELSEFYRAPVGFAGVRLSAADGNHYGWVKFVRDCVFSWVPFRLDSYALHPVPNTPILAGVFPQPELVVERGPGTITLSWRPEWKGYRLEWAQLLDSDVTWKPVDGVVDNRITLPTTAVAAYFRLAKLP